jgi:hypothetical protein
MAQLRHPLYFTGTLDIGERMKLLTKCAAAAIFFWAGAAGAALSRQEFAERAKDWFYVYAERLQFDDAFAARELNAWHDAWAAQIAQLKEFGGDKAEADIPFTADGKTVLNLLRSDMRAQKLFTDEKSPRDELVQAMIKSVEANPHSHAETIFESLKTLAESEARRKVTPAEREAEERKRRVELLAEFFAIDFRQKHGKEFKKTEAEKLSKVLTLAPADLLAGKTVGGAERDVAARLSEYIAAAEAAKSPVFTAKDLKESQPVFDSYRKHRKESLPKEEAAAYDALEAAMKQYLGLAQ